VRKIIQDEYAAAFELCDVLLMPACPFPAWDIGGKSHDPMAMYTADIMTVSQPIAKLPAICVPLSKSDQLPIGLQLVAKEGNDLNLIYIVKELKL
jgi:aspartyl-tRNA(Asn)/glutamyl-tRNA(Gln) amidotransferase subunit A